MIKKKNTLDLVISGSMPFIALILLALSNFVTFGFKVPDSSFWIKTVINTVSLLCFFLPFKSIFKDKYFGSERITTKLNAYSELVTKVYDGKLKSFNDWTAIEYTERKQRFVNQSLQLSAITYEEFILKYRMSIATVKNDKSLSVQEKKHLIKLLKMLPKIKQISSDECLPGTDSNTVFNRVSTSEEREDKKITLIKVLRSILICGAIAMLATTTDFSDFYSRYFAILTELGLKLLIGLWHILSASQISNKLVNKVYFNELSEKSLILTEFLETTKGE